MSAAALRARSSGRTPFSSRCVRLEADFSRENRNEALLARWPKIAGYPHLFVLDADGRLLHSQDTGVLERGEGYDAAKVRALLERWAGAPGARA